MDLHQSYTHNILDALLFLLAILENDAFEKCVWIL